MSLELTRIRSYALCEFEKFSGIFELFSILCEWFLSVLIFRQKNYPRRTEVQRPIVIALSEKKSIIEPSKSNMKLMLSFGQNLFRVKKPVGDLAVCVVMSNRMFRARQSVPQVGRLSVPRAIKNFVQTTHSVYAHQRAVSDVNYSILRPVFVELHFLYCLSDHEWFQIKFVYKCQTGVPLYFTRKFCYPLQSHKIENRLYFWVLVVLQHSTYLLSTVEYY